MHDNIQVAVVDDHPMLREGVARILAASPNIEVVGQGDTAEDAIRLARDHLPDILLLDISMKGGGINAAWEISAAFPVVKIVMLTASEREEDFIASMKAGARGYILKGVTARELIRIVQSIHAGESYVPPTLAASFLLELRERQGRKDIPTSPLDELTERERQVLELLATGCSNKEIARELELSEKMVKHSMTNILQKLQVRNRVQAALLAREAEHEHAPAPAPGRRRLRTGVMLAVLAIIGAGGGYLAGVHQTEQQIEAAAAEPWFEEASEYFRLFALDDRHLIELPATRIEAIEAKMSHFIKKELRVPDLSRHGLDFRGARLMALDGGPDGPELGKPAAMLLYDAPKGKSLAVVITPFANKPDDPPVSGRSGDMNLVSWFQSGHAYAVMAWAEPKFLRAVGADVADQLGAR